jgi:hypothetical protein
MHFKPASFKEAKTDHLKLLQDDHVDCVAGCYRCVLSYFNQPDHEYIERRDEEMQKILLRLVFGTSSKPEENRRDSSHFKVEKPKLDEETPQTSTATISDLPAPNEEALTLAGIEIPLVWRKKRIVAVDEKNITDQLRTELASKGVRLFILPADLKQQSKIYAQLKAALKG